MFISTGLSVHYEYVSPGPNAPELRISSPLFGVYSYPIPPSAEKGFWVSTLRTVEDTLDFPKGTVVQTIMSLQEPVVDRRKLRVNRFAAITPESQAADLEATMEREHVPDSAVIRQLDLDPEGKFYGWEFTWNEVTFK